MDKFNVLLNRIEQKLHEYKLQNPIILYDIVFKKHPDITKKIYISENLALRTKKQEYGPECSGAIFKDNKVLIQITEPINIMHKPEIDNVVNGLKKHTSYKLRLPYNDELDEKNYLTQDGITLAKNLYLVIEEEPQNIKQTKKDYFTNLKFNKAKWDNNYTNYIWTDRIENFPDSEFDPYSNMYTTKEAEKIRLTLIQKTGLNWNLSNYFDTNLHTDKQKLYLKAKDWIEK